MSESQRRKRKPYRLLSGTGKWLRLQKKCNEEEPVKSSTDDDPTEQPSDLLIAGPSTSQQAVQSYNTISEQEFDRQQQSSKSSSDVDVFGEPMTDSDDAIDQESDATVHKSSSESYDDADASSPKPDNISDVEDLKIFLRKWAIKHNVPISTLFSSCVGIKNTHPTCFNTLPSDGRTILKTPVTMIVQTVAPGEYIHIGLEIQLHKVVTKLKKSNISFDELGILCNIDGLPLFKSSPGELYPILLSIPTIPQLRNEVYPIGLYYGNKKPDLACFFEPFLKELLHLIENGLMFCNDNIKIKILGFCCDVPAKSYILGTTSHTGYSSCTRCTVHGTTIANRRVFLETDCPLRTHEQFINRDDLTYQPRETPLIAVPGLDFPSSFVLDYMHLICLGVMRTLLFIWCTGPLPLRISAGQRIRMSESLLNLRSDTPVEFVRKPRELTILKSWKATEYHMFLLYFGPVILKEVLDEARYLNFLSLHVATTILLDPKKCTNPELLEYADKLLLRFVQEVSTVYDEKYITHNFHNLIHLADDVRFFAPIIPQFDLQKISAFQFENFLQVVKRKVRGRAKPLQQIGRRIGEEFLNPIEEAITQLPCDKPVLLSKHYDGPLPAFCVNPQYKKIKFDSFEITVQHPNNCCLLTNGAIVLVDNVVFSRELKEQVLVGTKFCQLENLYEEPLCRSSDLGIYKVSGLSGRKIWPLSAVKAKCLLVNFNE